MNDTDRAALQVAQFDAARYKQDFEQACEHFWLTYAAGTEQTLETFNGVKGDKPWDEVAAHVAELRAAADDHKRIADHLLAEWSHEIGMGDPTNGESAADVVIRLLGELAQHRADPRAKHATTAGVG